MMYDYVTTCHQLLSWCLGNLMHIKEQVLETEQSFVTPTPANNDSLTHSRAANATSQGSDRPPGPVKSKEQLLALVEPDHQ